jgi:hypothetical protein
MEVDLSGVRLHVYEGQSHAHYFSDDSAPETSAVFGEITRRRLSSVAASVAGRPVADRQ